MAPVGRSVSAGRRCASDPVRRCNRHTADRTTRTTGWVGHRSTAPWLAVVCFIIGSCATSGCVPWQHARSGSTPACESDHLLRYYAAARHSGFEPVAPEVIAPGCADLYEQLIAQAEVLSVHEQPLQQDAEHDALHILVSDLALLVGRLRQETVKREALEQTNSALRHELEDLRQQIEALKRIDGRLEERVRTTP